MFSSSLRSWAICLALWINLATSQFCIAPGEFCLNGGTCIDEADAQFCACVPGWEGVFCECNCYSQGGVCVDNDNANDTIKGRLKCACYEGWFGPMCKQNCSRTTKCSNHGSCTDTGQCVCDSNWDGSDCSISLCDKCEASQHGVCQNDTCVCNGDRQGPLCGCSPSEDCGRRGRCNATSNVIQCLCEGGYSGSACEILPPTPGVVLCSAHQRCADCQSKPNCVWAESQCVMLGKTELPDLDNCESETSASVTLWVPIVASLGVAGLVGGLLWFFRRYRKYTNGKQQLTLTASAAGASPVNPWFSDDVTKEEYVYMEKEDDEDSVIR